MVSRKPKLGTQLELTLPTWGGRRDGAGRKRIAERPSVPHVVRPAVRGWNPLLITVRMQEGIPDLRSREAWAAMMRTLRKFRGMYPLQFVHYSVLFNHNHFIAECESREALARGMQAFSIRLAQSLNKCFGRTGPVFAGRYHARELTTPMEVRNALRYVLLNERHHAAEAGITMPPDWIDPRSTAAIFDGWREPPNSSKRLSDYGTSPARTWLLKTGWRRHGLLELDDIPARRRSSTRVAVPAHPLRESNLIEQK